ncbi:MAG: efflux RND transporter periplasmic adaptor subunit [Planctomycetales bacterium]|nr:efflux RND transporter periplasmic adaptor subunit [Planctomycetales bacterium]
MGDRSSNGTQIISIVPNGDAVNEGQLVVELDAATIREKLDEQTVEHQKAVSAKIQAVAKYDNQLLQNKTTLATAKLAVELAKLEFDMYMDPSSGTFQLAKEDIDRQIESAKNSTLEARAALELAKVDRSGMQRLFELGYRGKSDLEQSRLKFLQAEDRLASAINQMKTYQGSKSKLTEYEFEMQKLTLQGNIDTAVNALEQVKNDNESLAQQTRAARDEAINTESKEKERRERLEQQFENCKIYAPHDGMVVYHRERRGGMEIYEGALVRERQTILTIPDLSRMQVKTQVHEAVLDHVQKDLPATVKVDAFPDKTYRAIVDKVAVVPSSNGGWMGSSSVKTYDTIVRLIDEVQANELKPGMTAVVNIHVEELKDVVSVPVQAVVQVERNTWCYVKTQGGVERRDVKIGRSNDKFVHVIEGVDDGDQVVLNPMDIVDTQKTDEQSDTKEISPEEGSPELPESMQDFDPDDHRSESDQESTSAFPAFEGRGGPSGEGGAGRQRGGPGGAGPGMRGRPGGGPGGGNRPGGGNGQRGPRGGGGEARQPGPDAAES